MKGATGFVGKALVQRLLAEGHSVRVLTRVAGPARAALSGLKGPALEIVDGGKGGGRGGGARQRKGV